MPFPKRGIHGRKDIFRGVRRVQLPTLKREVCNAIDELSGGRLESTFLFIHFPFDDLLGELVCLLRRGGG